LNQPPEQSTTQALINFTRLAALLFPVLLGIYLLITSTTHLSDTLWQYDAKRMLQLVLLPLMFLWVLLIPSLRAAFSEQMARIPRWLGVALLLMFTLGLISAWYNSETPMGLAYSLADVALLFLLITAALAIAACRSIAGELFDRIVIVLIAMVGVAVGLQELIGVLAAWNSGVEFHPRVALLHFSWPRFYNQVQSWTIPVIAALPFVFPKKQSIWLLCLLSLALNWYVVVATGGRGTAVAVGIAVLFSAIVWPAARKQLLLTNIAGLMLGALIYSLVVIGHTQLKTVNPAAENAQKGSPHTTQSAEPAKDNGAKSLIGSTAASYKSESFTAPLTGERMATSSGRTAMWRGSLADTKAHPWLGIGPMNYACKGPIYRAAHPHSFPMQFLSEWGMPAFVLLLVVGVFIAFKLILTLRSGDETGKSIRFVQVALATGLIAAAIHACLSGVLIMPASQVAGILIAGWLLGALPVTPKQGLQRLPVNAVLILSLLVSFTFLWFAKSEISLHEQRLEQTPAMDRLIPRLWQNGKVCGLYQRSEAD